MINEYRVMRKIRRFIYLFYYLKEADYHQLKRFLFYSSEASGRSKTAIVADVLISAVKYNISFKDYFCFRFYDSSRTDREDWAGTGFMYEYQLRMNPKEARKILENKILFLEHYKDLIDRDYYPISSSGDNVQRLSGMLLNSSGRLVLKGSMGQIGAQVEVIECNHYTPESLLFYMKRNKFDLVEEYVIQHPELSRLSPSGLNTVRVITQVTGDKVDILGARLRVSVDSPVDNMAAGNLAAPVDYESGIVTGPAVYSDITKSPESIHPITGQAIENFRVPNWDSVIRLAETAALRAGANRSVGWDIAVTPDGAELIEGNHNWCKLLWQLPVNRGLKPELSKYE